MAKRPRDPSQLAKLIVDIATGEAKDTTSDAKRNPQNYPGDGRWGSATMVWSLEEIALLAG